MVSDYFAELATDLAREFPEGDPGNAPGFFFASDYVSRDNKRRVVFFISHGPPDEARVVTRVTYILPVSAAGAPLFKGEGVLPATPATYWEMPVPAGDSAPNMVAAYAAANNLATWESEVQRVTDGIAEANAKKARASRNILVFWRDSRSRLFDAVYAADIRMLRTTSGRTPSSERVRRQRAALPPRAASGGNPGQQRTSSSRRNRNSDPRSVSSRSSNRRRTRRMSRLPRSPPTPTKSSDPAPRISSNNPRGWI